MRGWLEKWEVLMATRANPPQRTPARRPNIKVHVEHTEFSPKFWLGLLELWGVDYQAIIDRDREVQV
jgi:hypothetical protein